MRSPIKKVKIFSFNLSTLSSKETSKLIIKWAASRKMSYILACSMNDVVLAEKSNEVAKALSKASLVTPDGMSLVLSTRLLKGKKIERVYGPDLMLAICRESQDKSITHYFYGSTSEVLKNLIKNLKTKFPRLEIAGAYSPPFRSLTGFEKKRNYKKIKDSKSNIVWVGLGASKQILWAAEASRKLHPCVIISVGAAFDFNAGSKKQAPKWIQNAGLEWSFRLTQEPRRLWRRYLFGIPVFAYLFLKELKIDFGRYLKNLRYVS